MIREDRYIVVKRKDAVAALTTDERIILSNLCGKINCYRRSADKLPLECVVVESDWPEYEQTWQDIERRVKSELLANYARNHFTREAEAHTETREKLADCVAALQLLLYGTDCELDSWGRSVFRFTTAKLATARAALAKVSQ